MYSEFPKPYWSRIDKSHGVHPLRAEKKRGTRVCKWEGGEPMDLPIHRSEESDHFEISNNICRFWLSIQDFRGRSYCFCSSGLFSMLPSVHIFINCLFPGIQVILDWMMGTIVFRSLHICDSLLISNVPLMHLFLAPWRYFLIRTFFHQAHLPKIIHHVSFIPNAKFIKEGLLSPDHLFPLGLLQSSSLSNDIFLN